MNIEFELEDGLWWQTTITSSVWDAFEDRSREHLRAATSQDKVLIFAPEEHDLEPLTAIELESVNWVFSNELELQKIIINALLEVYPKLQKNFDYNAQERDLLMPNVRDMEGFKTLISLESIFVHPVLKNNTPYVGFAFYCSWDLEHGLGVMVHGNRVVEIGGQDIAISQGIAEEDADKL